MRKKIFVIVFTSVLILTFFISQDFEVWDGSFSRYTYVMSLPENIRDLYKKNQDARDFVLSYKELNGMKSEIDLSSEICSEEVPLFMQWDKRWGYMEYSGDCVALTGCGPVCLSMAAVYLTKDENMSPDKIVEFSVKNKYYQNGYGSLWTLISEGGKRLGLNVEEIPLNEKLIIKNLQEGWPVICVMGKGDFTTTGHFVVMHKYEDGKIYINDPNSYSNSEKGWDYERIAPQIKNLWVCSV